MPASRQRLGAFGESYARAYLGRMGYTIIASNVRVGAAGEIDLLALDSETLVFVEVRARRGQRMGVPEESITPEKSARMVRVAQKYLETLPLQPVDWRVDLLALELDAAGRVIRSNHIKNAVTEQGYQPRRGPRTRRG